MAQKELLVLVLNLGTTFVALSFAPLGCVYLIRYMY